jgi:hypothetical protein
MPFLVVFLKKFYHKKGITTFWKKIWWKTPVFFICFDSNFDFKKIWERKFLRTFFFSLDPDPDWEKRLIRIRIKSIRIQNPVIKQWKEKRNSNNRFSISRNNNNKKYCFLSAIERRVQRSGCCAPSTNGHFECIVKQNRSFPHKLPPKHPHTPPPYQSHSRDGAA